MNAIPDGDLVALQISERICGRLSLEQVVGRHGIHLYYCAVLAYSTWYGDESNCVFEEQPSLTPASGLRREFYMLEGLHFDRLSAVHEWCVAPLLGSLYGGVDEQRVALNDFYILHRAVFSDG